VTARHRGPLHLKTPLRPVPGAVIPAAARSAGAAIIRRYSGGGTVVTDDGTLFVSLLCNKEDVEGAPQYPRELMRWSEGFYAPVLAALRGPGAAAHLPFGLVEHDYCLGELKFGGNAQTISRGRWVHHTSFLWDFQPARMELLRLPEKRPAYRRDRPHGSFLTPLARHLPHGAAPDAFLDAVEARLREVFDVRPAAYEEAAHILATTTERQSSMLLEY
jgi:lipoate-protein ligase A